MVTGAARPRRNHGTWLLSLAAALAAVAIAGAVVWGTAAARHGLIVFRPTGLQVKDQIVMPVGRGTGGTVQLRAGCAYDIELRCACWSDLEKKVNPGIRAYVRYIGDRHATAAVSICLDPYRRPADRGLQRFTCAFDPGWAGEADWRISTEYLPGTPVPETGNFIVKSMTMRERVKLAPLWWAGLLAALAAALERAAARGWPAAGQITLRRVGAGTAYLLFLAVLFLAAFEAYFRMLPERLPQQVLNGFSDHGFHLLNGTKDLVYNPRTQYSYRPHRRMSRNVIGQFGPVQSAGGEKVLLLFRGEDLPDRPPDRQPFSYVHDGRGFRSPSGLDESSILTVSSSYFVTPGMPDDLTFPGRLQALTGERVCNIAQGGWPVGALLNALEDTLERAGRPMTVVYGAIITHFRPEQVGALPAEDGGSWPPESVSVFADLADKPPPALPLGLLASTLPGHWRHYLGIGAARPALFQLNTWAGSDLGAFMKDRALGTIREFTWAGRTEPLYFHSERVFTYFNRPYTPESVAVWLDRLAAVTSKHGCRLLIALIPSKYASMAWALENQITREDLTGPMGVSEAALLADIPPWEQLARVQAGLMQEIRANAARHAFGVVDLLPVMQDSVAAGGLPFFRFDTHWNQDGTGLAARETARWLADHGWTKTEQEGQASD